MVKKMLVIIATRDNNSALAIVKKLQSQKIKEYAAGMLNKTVEEITRITI